MPAVLTEWCKNVQVQNCSADEVEMSVSGFSQNGHDSLSPILVEYLILHDMTVICHCTKKLTDTSDFYLSDRNWKLTKVLINSPMFWTSDHGVKLERTKMILMRTESERRKLKNEEHVLFISCLWCPVIRVGEVCEVYIFVWEKKIRWWYIAVAYLRCVGSGRCLQERTHRDKVNFSCISHCLCTFLYAWRHTKTLNFNSVVGLDASEKDWETLNFQENWSCILFCVQYICVV